MPFLFFDIKYVMPLLAHVTSIYEQLLIKQQYAKICIKMTLGML